MNFKKLSIGLASLAVLASAIFLLAGKRSSKDTPQAAKPPTPNTSTTLGSSLPNQQVQNLEQAKKSLSFNPLLPTSQLNGETLSNIKVGTKSNMFDDSDTIYLTYADSQGTLYKMSQSTKTFNDPTDVEKVSIQINGKQITASFYQLEEVGGGSGPNSAGSDVTSPTSYLSWVSNGVRYEISEFGRVTMKQLTLIATSLE